MGIQTKFFIRFFAKTRIKELIPTVSKLKDPKNLILIDFVFLRNEKSAF